MTDPSSVSSTRSQRPRIRTGPDATHEVGYFEAAGTRRFHAEHDPIAWERVELAGERPVACDGRGGCDAQLVHQPGRHRLGGFPAIGCRDAGAALERLQPQ